jgi:hypothetical protein
MKHSRLSAIFVKTDGRNMDKIGQLCGIISLHGIGRPEQIREYFGFPASRTIWSSDGYWGGTGDPDAAGRGGMGEDVAAEIGERISAFSGLGFELLPRGCYLRNNDRANVDDFFSRVMIRMTGRG